MNYLNSSLPTGETPLVPLPGLARKLSWRGKIYGKCELANPTGSFKDRGSIAEVAAAKKRREKGVVCASTGNMAASLSAFAARTRLPCVTFVPENTLPGKIKQALMYGAKIIKTKGTYDDCVRQAEKFARKNNYLLCGDYELRRRGQATIGAELASAGVKIDAVICPVGNGTVALAIAEGMAQLGQFPDLIGVQAKGVAPLAEAFSQNKRNFQVNPNPKTLASAIRVGNPLDGKEILSWIATYGGSIKAVTDEEMRQAQLLLARKEGIYTELAAAGTVTVLPALDPTQNVVLILTGNGLKEGGEMI